MGASPRGAVPTFATLAALLCAALAAPSVRAQIQLPGRGQTPTAPATAVPVVLPPAARAAGLNVSRLALEGAVDAQEYIVGPGDVFTVAIGGAVPRQIPATVSADGRLVVPEAGNFEAAGRTLARVRSDVRGELQQRYRNVTADLSLSEPRTFYVHVSGNVPEPGRQLVPAVARVEDAIVEASGTEIYALAKYGAPQNRPEQRWPALRNVSVTRRSGAARTVDLMRYFATGDLSANPYLQDGDALYVPTFDPRVEGVVVSGAVDRPGAYDVRPGDTALDLLVVTSGQDASARVARVRRVRPAGGGAAETREVAFADAASLDVRARDQIYAVMAEPNAASADAVGAVRYPGTYPIVEGETTLAELVEMAGGLRDDALLRAASLERPQRGGTVQTATDAASSDAVQTDVSVEGDLLGGLFGRQFYANETGRPVRVSIDPTEAVSGAQPVVLRGGDVLRVPFDYGLVRVYGRVVRGGYVPFRAGAEARDYVERAGGLGPSASTVYVVDAESGQLVPGLETTVQPGDAVFVNSLPSPDTPEFAQLALQQRQDERDDARDRRQARYQLIGTVLSAVGTLVSVLIAYTAISSD